MRVIRTETHFDPDYIKRREDKGLKNANVCFAWIRTQEESGSSWQRLPDIERAEAITPEQVPLVLDYILRQERIQPLSLLKESLLNPSYVERVLAEKIVIEHSPPDLATLGNILKEGVKGSTVALSVYVAVNGDAYLFITLPAALLVIGASKGLSKWLEQNIPRMMTKITKRWLR